MNWLSERVKKEVRWIRRRKVRNNRGENKNERKLTSGLIYRQFIYLLEWVFTLTCTCMPYVWPWSSTRIASTLIGLLSVSAMTLAKPVGKSPGTCFGWRLVSTVHTGSERLQRDRTPGRHRSISGRHFLRIKEAICGENDWNPVLLLYWTAAQQEDSLDFGLHNLSLDENEITGKNMHRHLHDNRCLSHETLCTI